MGANQRKRKAMAKQRQAVAASATPMLARLDSDYRRRNPARTKPKTPPDWVTDLVSSGHQYIKGDRAPAMAQTRQQKQDNRQVRKARAADTARVARPVTREMPVRTHTPRSISSKRGTGHPVRDSASPTSGVEFKRERNWQKVTKGKV